MVWNRLQKHRLLLFFNISWACCDTSWNNLLWKKALLSLFFFSNVTVNITLMYVIAAAISIWWKASYSSISHFLLLSRNKKNWLKMHYSNTFNVNIEEVWEQPQPSLCLMWSWKYFKYSVLQAFIHSAEGKYFFKQILGAQERCLYLAHSRIWINVWWLTRVEVHWDSRIGVTHRDPLMPLDMEIPPVGSSGWAHGNPQPLWAIRVLPRIWLLVRGRAGFDFTIGVLSPLHQVSHHSDF